MTTLKGIFPDPKPVRRKNFIHENVKNLHSMRKSLHTSKGLQEIQKSHIYNQRKINSNNQHNNNHDDAVPILNKTTSYAKKATHSANTNLSVKQKKEVPKQSHRSMKKLHGKVVSDSTLSYTPVRDKKKTIRNQNEVKNQGIQTLNESEIDNLYSEGIIKYPSKKCLGSNQSLNKSEINDQNDKSLKDTLNLPIEGGDTQVVKKNVQNKNDIKSSQVTFSKEGTDFIKLNKERSSLTNKTTTQIKGNASNCKHNNNNDASSTPNYRMGVVPKYIKDRKEAQEKEQKAKTAELDANCPSGHVPLPDHERKETLRMLRKNYQDYVNELNMMPIKVDTLRAQRRKIEIEKELNKLEEGIKVFSRPKVYVKMNA